MSDGRDDRKAALVAAAHQAVAEHGLEGLRLRTVAAEVGIDHSTLHHHFATKQDLIEAVVAFATAPLRSTLPTEGTPPARLTTHLKRLAALITTDPDRHGEGRSARPSPCSRGPDADMRTPGIPVGSPVTGRITISGPADRLIVIGATLALVGGATHGDLPEGSGAAALQFVADHPAYALVHFVSILGVRGLGGGSGPACP